MKPKLTIDRPALAFLVAFVTVTCTIANPLMGWVIVLASCVSLMLLYKVFHPQLKRIETRILNLFALFCLATLIFFASDFGLLNTMINLLMVACCLKMINLHRKSDYQAVAITLMFLVSCGMIFHQEILYSIFYCFIVCLLFIVLNAAEFSAKKYQLKSAVTYPILLQAIPITVLLFFVTPKLPPLWQVPAGQGTETGLSEEVTPGDIANLAKSDDLVFRADFTGDVPNGAELYWRAIVMDAFDGKTWSINKRDQNYYNWTETALPVAQTQRAFEYVVIAEPTSTQWLYSLDIPKLMLETGTKRLNFTSQYQLKADAPFYTQGMYSVRSYPDAQLSFFADDLDTSGYLQVPISGNPRTQSFVETNLSVLKTYEEKLSFLHQFFISQAFEYTLQPPIMPNNPVDTFLFDQQRGFCSHYASAFAYMLRLSGIPSRLVTGYQGGEQQIDNVISVYQYDAHAWVEAWHPTQGWKRYDPTALVAPNRVMDGLRESLQNRDEFMQDSLFSLAHLKDFPVLGDLRLILEKLDYNWSHTVLSFNQQTQRDMFKDMFGEINARIMSTILAAGFVSIGLFLALLFAYKSYRPSTQIEKLNSQLLKKAKRLGIKKHNSETFSQLALRLAASCDEVNEANAKHVIQAYNKLVYGRNQQLSKQVQHLRRLIKRL